MAKKTKIYCVYCGTENVLEDKKCKKCKKKLDPKNRPVYDYLTDKLKDKVDGKLQDNIFSLVTNFIQSHLYGTVLTCSIIFAVAAGVGNVLNKSNDYDVVSEKPAVSIQYEYLGEGLTPEEIVVKYGNALNEGDLNTVKAYELKTFYPDIYEELNGSEVKNNDVVYYTHLNKNPLYDNASLLFKMEDSVALGYYIGGNPTGKYGDYSFERQLLNIGYDYTESDDEKDSGYGFEYEIEFIKVGDDYYISGTELMPFYSIGHQMHYEFFMKYKGDTTKFNKADVDKYIDEIDGD